MDERMFDNPFEIDIHRRNNKNISPLAMVRTFVSGHRWQGWS